MAIGVGKLLTIAEHAQHIRMAANAGGDGAGSEAGHGAVSYTHLDVYKRQDEAVRSIALRLGVDSERFAQVLALVKDHLLAQFARLPDTGSIVAVAKELG